MVGAAHASFSWYEPFRHAMARGPGASSLTRSMISRDWPELTPGAAPLMAADG